MIRGMAQPSCWIGPRRAAFGATGAKRPASRIRGRATRSWFGLAREPGSRIRDVAVGKGDEMVACRNRPCARRRGVEERAERDRPSLAGDVREEALPSLFPAGTRIGRGRGDHTNAATGSHALDMICLEPRYSIYLG